MNMNDGLAEWPIDQQRNKNETNQTKRTSMMQWYAFDQRSALWTKKKMQIALLHQL